MPDLVSIQQQIAQNAPKREPRKRIPKRIVKAVTLLASGECKTQKAAAERVGMNAAYLCEVLKKPKIAAFLSERARQNLAQGVLRASVRVMELIDGQSEHVALDAAKHVLAIEGIKPADSQPVVNVNVSPGYVIDLQQDPRTIEHEDK